MIGIKVPLSEAEKAKRLLLNENIINTEYKPVIKDRHVCFPVIRFRKGLGRKVNMSFPPKVSGVSLKEGMEKSVPKKLASIIPAGYDLVGDIAILEMPAELVKYQTKLAKYILSTRPNVRVVLKKAGSHSGVYRRQKLAWLAGEKRKETIHRENGVQLKLNVETVYFSARLSHERSRIASSVQPGEKVLVMFSGCGPYPMVIAKNSLAKEIHGIEINPAGHKYAVENAKLNKLGNINLYCGDVRKVLPKLKMKFDRIIMPLPKTADDFLDLAIPRLKKGGMLNFYDFQEESNTKISEEKVMAHFAKRRCSILRTVLCGQHSPRVFRLCVDCRAG